MSLAMTDKLHGTNDVTVFALVEETGVDHLLGRFARVARGTGTVVYVGAHNTERPSWTGHDCLNDGEPEDCTCVRVIFRYRHTCVNQGNHFHDARRFFARAMEDDRYMAEIEDLDLNGWEAS